MLRAFLAVLLLLSQGLRPTLALADDRKEWMFSEFNDAANNGRTTATLIYGVPETDDIQVTGACDATSGTSASFSRLTFGADIGNLESGKEASIRFSGSGTEQELKGSVHRAQGEADVNGIVITIEHSHPLWNILSSNDHVDYQVPGYRSVPLPLRRGQENIGKFLAACNRLANAQSSPTNAAAPAENGSAEKDAFEAAKELGTRDGWQAFLRNYPNGFQADLARAYLKKLEGDAEPAPGNSTTAAATPTPQAAMDPLTIEGTSSRISCKQLFKIKSAPSGTSAKISFVNKSSTVRSIQWLDDKGQPKDMASLGSGDRDEFNSVTSHPWMVATGPGDCIEILYPGPNGTIVELVDGNGTSGKQSSSSTERKKANKKTEKKTAKVTGCEEGYKLVKGKCKRIGANEKPQGCPKGTVPVPETDDCVPANKKSAGQNQQNNSQQQDPAQQVQQIIQGIKNIQKKCAPGTNWNAQAKACI